MSLRFFHYLFILPLFIVLGLANAGLSAYLEYQEVQASLAEEMFIVASIQAEWPAHLPSPNVVNAPSVSDQEAVLADLKRSLWLRALFFSVAGLFVGVFVSELLTRLSLREIKLLQHPASQIAEGHTDVSVTPGRIREYADLGGTLNTLAQILRENFQHTRSRLLRSDDRK